MVEGGQSNLAKVHLDVVHTREETKKTDLKYLDKMLSKNILCNTLAPIGSIQPVPTVRHVTTETSENTGAQSTLLPANHFNLLLMPGRANHLL